MNFFKLYIGDYQRDTAHLSIAEHGAYMLMLQHYYATEKPLPAGKALHRMLRAQDKAERDAIDAVASQFWTPSQSGLVNDRADSEIRKADHQRTINRETGKLGGRPKRTEPITESVSESVSEVDPINNPNQTPDTIKDPPLPPKGENRRGGTTKTFRGWLEDVRSSDDKPIPEGDPIFAYCEEIGLPLEFLTLHWREFKRQYGESDKRYADWRRVLRTSVRRNWFKFWWMGAGQEPTLTTAGEQARREFDHREAA